MTTPDPAHWTARRNDERAHDLFDDGVLCGHIYHPWDPQKIADALNAARQHEGCTHATDTLRRAADLLAGSESDDPSIGQALALLDRLLTAEGSEQ